MPHQDLGIRPAAPVGFVTVAARVNPDRSAPPLGAGSVLRLIRDGEAVTRADLARRTGLARSTVAQRVDALLAHELVYEAGGSASTGGGPPPPPPLHPRAGGGLGAPPRAAPSPLGGFDPPGAPPPPRGPPP